MTDTNEPESETSIGEQTARLEQIITQLEDGEVSLERAKELHEEGQAILKSLDSDLEVGDGSIKVEN